MTDRSRRGDGRMLGQPILLLGMHRSGTSVATRMLTLLGLRTPSGVLLPADEDNPRGYWESQELTDFDDRVLEALGCPWYAPPSLGDVQKRLADLDPLLPEARRLASRAFSGPGTVAWKDPRNCLLLPFWETVLGGTGPTLIVHRAPIEVAESVRRRNGFSVPFTLALWERHLRGALLATAGRPVHVEGYAALLGDPAGWTTRVLAYLITQGVRATAPTGELASEFFAPRSAPAEDETADRLLSPQQRDLLDLVLQLEGTSTVLTPSDIPPETPTTPALLDEARATWSVRRHAKRSEEALREVETRAGAAEELLASRTRDWQARLEELDAASRAATARAQNATARAEAARAQAATAEAQATAAQARAQAEAARTADLSARLEERTRELVWAQARVQAVETSTSWRLTEPLRRASETRRAVADHPVGRGVRLAKAVARGRGKDELRRRRQRKLVESSGLFDTELYVRENPDVHPKKALDHYLDHGADEGRRPNRLFDSDWYLGTYPDVSAAGLNPLVHYLLTGAAEGRDPCPGFTSSYYLATNPDVRESGINPLAHYLQHGEREGRLARSPSDAEDTDDAPAVPRPIAPSHDDWAGVARPAGADNPEVLVVVPVYRGFDETLRCLYSVLTSPVRTPYRLVVVDDASPEPEISAELRWLAERGLFELLVNPENAGFVHSVNRGMQLAHGHDVLLLNSDTEVHGDWLDRLRAAATNDPRCGTVTPLTNSGTIASYPRFVRDNASALEVDDATLDGLAADALRGERIQIPTCVGFCVYLRGDCLTDVGLFDEEAFGFGYGEENDFSLRAAAAGWSNVLAADVFVRHYGSTSFGESAPARQRVGLEVLNARHPGYDRLVADHITSDPAAPLRRRLDLARLQAVRRGRPTVLLVAHALGGGTTRHVHELARQLDAEGVLPILLRPRGFGGQVALTSPDVRPLPNLIFDLSSGEDPDLVQALRDLDVRHLHVHHLQGLPDGTRTLPALAQALDVQYDVTLHDWMTVCPRITMVDHTRRFCGGPQVDKCRRCIARNSSPFGKPDAGAWQEEHSLFLYGARRVFTPSDDTAGRYRALLPGLEVTVAPHADTTRQSVVATPAPVDGRTHVAVLGAVNLSKGSEVLLRLAEDAQRRRLPLHFHVFGYTDIDAALSRFSTVSITGRYDPADLPSLVRASGCRTALFPAVWPETYSYTLSEAFDLGLEPVAFDIGAIAGRMRASARGTVLPWDMLDRPRDVNEALLEVLASDAPPTREPTSYGSLLKDYYALDLPSTPR